MRQALYRVTLSGQGLQMWIEGSPVPVSAGFVKNEFVLASSEVQASRRAVQRVGARLQQQLETGALVRGGSEVDVDRVARSSQYWKLLLPEEFVYLTAPPWPPSPATGPRASSRSAPGDAPSRGCARRRRCRGPLPR
jgi:hypothetical protein